MARDNPVGPDNVVGHFVSEHPWLTALIGTAALGAAGWTGAYVASLVIGSKAPSTDLLHNPATATGPTSTSTSTTTSPAPSTSTPAVPQYDPSTAEWIYAQSAGKVITVGQSFVLVDASTGSAVDFVSEDPQGLIAHGPTTGTYVAVEAGTVNLTTSVGRMTIEIQPKTGTAGVAAAPRIPKRPPFPLLPRFLRGA